MALRQFSKDIPAGESVEYNIPTFYSPITIALIPGSGGTLTMTYKLVDDSEWEEIDDGPASARSEIVVDYPLTWLKFTAATEDARVELVHA